MAMLSNEKLRKVLQRFCIEKCLGFVYLISQWAHHVVKLLTFTILNELINLWAHHVVKVLTFTIPQWAHQLVSSPCGESVIVNFHYSPMSSPFGEIIIFQFVGERWTPIKNTITDGGSTASINGYSKLIYQTIKLLKVF